MIEHTARPTAQVPRIGALYGPTSAAGPDSLRLLLRAHAAPSVVTVGTFDGVHRGHRALVRAARTLARRRGLKTIAVTFSPRPEQLFAARTPPPDVCSVDERVRRLRRAGADDVVVVPFDRDVAGIGHVDFAAMLVFELGMRALYVGEDFGLGAGRAGTPEVLRRLGLEVHCHALVPNAAGTAKASSTSVRQAMARGADPAHALAAG